MTEEGLRAVLLEYSKSVGYPCGHFADAVCSCGGRTFELHVDDVEGVAVRVCAGCGDVHPIGDYGDRLDDAVLTNCACLCGNGIFEVTVGVAREPQSDAVRWMYVGGRCSDCGIMTSHGDWKKEFPDYRKFLTMI